MELSGSNDNTEKWLGKHMVQGAKGNENQYLLQKHFPLYNIACYNLIQDMIIYLWDIQRRYLAMEAEKVIGLAKDTA